MWPFGKKKAEAPKPTRQQKRKLQRDLRKLRKKVARKAELTLRDERIPRWIRDAKRRQLEARGLLARQHDRQDATTTKTQRQ